MGLINLLFDIGVLVFLVRAVVPNEGHMAFNRPYQTTIGLLAPLWKRLKVSERQASQAAWIGILVLAGLRALLWALLGDSMLNFEVTVIPVPPSRPFQAQLLSLVALGVFVLQVYIGITLAIVIGDLENRTDHYSRLLRAMLGPLRKSPPAPRCVIPIAALFLFWSIASWVLTLLHVMPSPRQGVVGCVLGAIPATMALTVDLARVWIGLLIARAVLSLVPVWRTPIVEWINRLTEPVVKPFLRFRLQVAQFDFTPLVALVALAVLHFFILLGLGRMYEVL